MRKFLLGVTLVTLSSSASPAWSQAPAPAPAAARPPVPNVVVDPGPIGPSPYEAVDGWLKPFDPGFTFGGNVGVQPDTPNRIFILQRGSTRLPNPVPAGYEGFPGSIGMQPSRGEGKVYRNMIFVVDGTGKMIETWNQWDHVLERTDSDVSMHRIRISPYDKERRVWVIDESGHQILVFSNDGRQLLMQLGERNVHASDKTHFGKPQDVAFLPDGRVLVADGLMNTRIVVLDAKGKYLSEFGTKGTNPGQFLTVHGVTTAPDGTVYAVDRDGRQVQVFKESGGKFVHQQTWKGFELPLDVFISGNDVWVSDLGKPKVIKFNKSGKRLYTWFWNAEGKDRFREMHTIIVDADGNLYGADNQLGRTQKFVPKKGADPKLLLKLTAR
jgi:DNA-binding beta-propeller fold protein YncE